MNPITHDCMRTHLELTSGDAEFQNEILRATWSNIIRLLFVRPMLSMLGDKTH